jgi:O-antigen/teichoic acid export membrane protein
MPELAPSAKRASLLFEVVPGLIARAGRQTFWPLLDQGLVSVGNFLALVVVARGLPTKSEYGTFGLLLECIFYANTLQSALIVYPLTLKGASATHDDLRRMAGASLSMTLLICLPIVLAALAWASLSKNLVLGLAAAFAFVVWQIQELVRRSLMAHFRYAEAAWGDGLRYLGTAACLGFLWMRGGLTLPVVFIVIGVFGAIAVVIQTLQVRPWMSGLSDLWALAREFATVGRWMLLSSVSAVLISVCGVWTISLFHGNDFVGEFYAIANFTKPVNPLLATLCGLVMQHAARMYDSGGIVAARRIALKFSAVTCAVTLPYLLLVVAFPGAAMRVLYGASSHFRDPTGELALRVFAVSFIIYVFMSLIGSFMNGVHRTRENFYAQVVNSVATLAIAFPLTIKYGLLGHVVGGTITAAVQAAAMVYFLRRAR